MMKRQKNKTRSGYDAGTTQVQCRYGEMRTKSERNSNRSEQACSKTRTTFEQMKHMSEAGADKYERERTGSEQNAERRGQKKQVENILEEIYMYLCVQKDEFLYAFIRNNWKA